MRLKAAIVAIGLAVTATLGVVTTTGSAAHAVSCPDLDWETYDGRIELFFASNGTRIHGGPSTVCRTVGVGQANHGAQLDCYKEGDDGTWSHLYDYVNSRTGWVNDTLLVGGGSYVHC